MASIDRLDDAAPVVGYLEAAGDFGARAVTTLVAEAAGKIAAGAGTASHRTSAPGHQLDSLQALHHMRDVVDRLGEPERT